MRCAVIDSNNQLINMIVADVNDLPPEGCVLVEIPDGMYWDGTKVSQIPISEEGE